MDTRLHKQVEFCREIDKEKLIDSKTYLTGAVRFENDAEHAWHAALMAILLKLQTLKNSFGTHGIFPTEEHQQRKQGHINNSRQTAYSTSYHQ